MTGVQTCALPICLGSLVKGAGRTLGKMALPVAAADLASTGFDLANTPIEDIRKYYGMSTENPSYLGDVAAKTRALVGMMNPFGSASEDLAHMRRGQSVEAARLVPEARARLKDPTVQAQLAALDQDFKETLPPNALDMQKLTPEQVAALKAQRQDGAAPAARPQPMAAPAAAPAAQAPAQTDEWSAAARTMMNQKPEDVRNQQIEWLKAQLAPGEREHAKLQAERLAGIEALRPPQRTMEDKIASALMGMGSSRYLGFGIANAAQQERAAQEAERARNMEIHNQIMDIKQKGLDLTRANLNAALTAGNEAYKETLQGKAKGLETGAGIHKTALERASAEEVARQNRAAHVEAAKISSRNNQIDLYTTLGGGDIQKGWAIAHPNDKKTLLDHFNDWLKNQSDLVKMAPQEEQMARFMGTVGRLVGSGKPTGTILDAGK